ncbi:MAG: MaoC family dehydratase [Clostridiales bacterium]|jgi:3-hydroxybutyryl-CoA dehydratase|nr:MaoC family dehydratase [Clostridiales bacterium]
MNSYSINELKIDQAAEMTRSVSEGDIYIFAGVTGDFNPVHIDKAFAEKSIFGGRIAHGMLSAGFISAVLGTELPGVGCIYLSQQIKFRAPVEIGDTIRAVVTVTDINLEKNRVTLKTECINQDGVIAVDGQAVIMPVKK